MEGHMVSHVEGHVAAMWNAMWLPCEPPPLSQFCFKLSRARRVTCQLSQNVAAMVNLARDLVDTCTHVVSPPAVIGESTVKGIAYYNVWYNFSVIKHMNFSNPD
jgi:hypothetical protein